MPRVTAIMARCGSWAHALSCLITFLPGLLLSDAFCVPRLLRSPNGRVLFRREGRPRTAPDRPLSSGRRSTRSHARVPPGLPPGMNSAMGGNGEGEGEGDGENGDEVGVLAGLKQWWNTDGKSDLKIYGTSLALALTVRTIALEPRYIPSLSMFPTFEIGDQLAVDKLSAKLSRPYQRKDVVVFHPPPKFSEFSSRGMDEALIKRVIAVDGDTVEIKDGALFINGQEQFEDYTFEEPEYKWGPQTVPEGMVMVLGDNRNHSLDSHVWGFLPRENVIGRAIFKYWPPWRAGLVEV